MIKVSIEQDQVKLTSPLMDSVTFSVPASSDTAETRVVKCVDWLFIVMPVKLHGYILFHTEFGGSKFQLLTVEMKLPSGSHNKFSFRILELDWYIIHIHILRGLLRQRPLCHFWRKQMG